MGQSLTLKDQQNLSLDTNKSLLESYWGFDGFNGFHKAIETVIKYK